MLTQILIAPLFIAASAMAHPAVVRRADVPLSEWSSQNLEVGDTSREKSLMLIIKK